MEQDTQDVTGGIFNLLSINGPMDTRDVIDTLVREGFSEGRVREGFWDLWNDYKVRFVNDSQIEVYTRQ